jgi:MtaA/CmuA family methyltransferase
MIKTVSETEWTPPLVAEEQMRSDDMEQMTPKQRVRVAMSGGQPDRVPVLPAIWWDHAARVCGTDFLDLLRNFQLLYDVMPEAARHYGADGIRIWSRYPSRRIEQRGDIHVELDRRTGVVLGRIDTLGRGNLLAPPPKPRIETYEDLVWFMAASPSESGPIIRDKSDLQALPVPSVENWAADMAPVKAMVDHWGDELFVAGACSGQTVDALALYRGGQQAMEDLSDNPHFAMAIMEKATDISINRAIAYAQAGVDALYIGDAWASASLISPTMFREFCLPLYQKFVRTVLPYGVLIYLHVCGKSTPILELMADTGVHCIDPLDPLGGVDVADAKRRVGQRVALMGGVNTITLASGTRDETLQESRTCIRKGAQGGGYILGAGDMVPRDSPFENVRAMVQAAQEFGTYPLRF